MYKKTFRPELYAKMDSLINRYGSDENFVAHMHEWPRTIKELIYNSMELMVRFKLVEPIPDHLNDEEAFIGME